MPISTEMILCIVIVIFLLVGSVFIARAMRSEREDYLNLSNLAYGEVDTKLQLEYYDKLYGYDPERWARNEQTYSLY